MAEAAVEGLHRDMNRVHSIIHVTVIVKCALTAAHITMANHKPHMHHSAAPGCARFARVNKISGDVKPPTLHTHRHLCRKVNTFLNVLFVTFDVPFCVTRCFA